MERRKRLYFGIAMLTIGAVAAVMLVGGNVHPLWRLLLVLPLFGGATGVFEAREQTCIALASRNQHNLDSGAEAIGDRAELAQIGRQARKVQIEAAVIALVTTAIVVAIPSPA